MTNQTPDIFKMLSQLKSNPLGILRQRFNLPDNLSNPNDIIQHLLNTNQISQDQVNKAMTMRNNPIFKQFFSNN